ncbi:unnamed protein product, partial [Rotaria sp. Silwood1]
MSCRQLIPTTFEDNSIGWRSLASQMNRTEERLGR